MNAQELKQRLQGKKVRVIGHHPGAPTDGYDHGIAELNDAWDVNGQVGFSIAHHTWTGIDRWHEGKNALYGYYGAAVWPENEPGLVCLIDA